MKNKNNQPSPATNSGVSFFYRGSEITDNRVFTIVVGTLLSFIIVAAISGGGLLTFTSTFAVPFHTTLFLIIMGVYAIISLLLFQLPKKIAGFSTLGVLVLLIIYFLVNMNSVIDGFGYIKDFVIIGIAKSMRWGEPNLSYVFSNAMKADTTAALIIVGIPLVTVTSFCTIRKINFPIPFILTFALFEIGALFSCVPNYICFAVMMSGWMGLAAMHLASIVRKVKKRRRDKKRSKTPAAKRRQSFIASIGVVVAVLSFLVFTFGNMVLGFTGYNRPEDIKALRSTFKNSISDFIDYIMGVDNDGSLREGRLYQMDDRVIKNRHYMTVEAPFKEQTYIRGYIGGKYTGDAWNPNVIDQSYGWLEDAFESTGYYPQSMQGALLNAMDGKNTFVTSSKGVVKISDLRRKKDYAYTTYIPLIDNSFKLNGDSMIEPGNKSSYSYTTYMDSNNFYMFKISELYKDKQFASVWSEYTRYVNEIYTQYPTGNADVANIVDALKNGTGHGYEKIGRAYSNIEIADRIRTYLSKNVKYSLDVDKLPANTDFVNWLLNDAKKGYSAHYASAMALMLRMADVPTRYVEGYVILPEDFKKATALADKGYYSVELTDMHAHAWIEIYDSNHGWMPIEATPGFYTGSLMDGMNTEDMDQLEQEADQEIEHNESTDDIIEVEMEDFPYFEESVEEEEIPVNKTLATIIAVIKYTYVFVGVAVSSFVVLFILFLIILFIRRTFFKSSLRKVLHKGNREKRVTSIYRYYNRLLKFENIDNDEQLPYFEYAKKVCESSDRLRGEQHMRAMNIFLKHRFSNEPLTENELTCLENLAVEYRNNSLKQLTGMEKFRFMYIENLG